MQCVCLEDLLVMILGRGPAKIDGVVDVMDFHYLSLCVHCAVRVGRYITAIFWYPLLCGGDGEYDQSSVMNTWGKMGDCINSMHVMYICDAPLWCTMQ